LDSDPVADGKVFSDQNLSQWRMLLKGEFVIAGNVYAQSTQMVFEARDPF